MTLTEPEVGAVIATIARAGALSATAPVIGDAGVPLRARLVFVIAIGGAVGASRPGISYADLPLSLVLELAAGLLTGLAARFILSRAAIAGQLAGLSLGLGFASQYDVHAGESAGTLRTLVASIAALAFLGAGGLEALVRSIAAPAHASHLSNLGPILLREGADAMSRGLSLAAPLLLAALVGNISLALMNRAAPAANVFSIAFPAVLLLGGAVLLATAPDLVLGITDTARDALGFLGR
jgi:flagellar biosynthesis protein FliR